MSSKSIGKAKLVKDPLTGKVTLQRVYAFDASKKRRITKSKKVKVARK